MSTPSDIETTEARQLVDQLEPMLADTIEARGAMLRFTMDVPVEWATLAAWLILNADREAGSIDETAPRPIELLTAEGVPGRDWARAKAYFRMVIGEALDDAWHKLRATAYPVHDHAADDDAPDCEIGPELRATLKDDIPF